MRVIVTREQYSEDPSSVISYNEDTDTIQEVLGNHYRDPAEFKDYGPDAGMFRYPDAGYPGGARTMLWNVMDVE